MLSQKRRCTLCIIEHFGNADAVPQPPERCLSRQAGIVRCCLKYYSPGSAFAEPGLLLYPECG